MANGNINSLPKDKIAKAFDYVCDYWPRLIRSHTEASNTLIGLPKPYVVPADQYGNFRFNEQYYWDSYFIALGLIACGRNQLAEDMLENLFYMFGQLGMVPNASRLYTTSRSQPPMLTSYILLIYHANNKNTDWLKRAYEIAQEEYLNVWLSEKHPHWHQVYMGLSRYYDTNVLHDLAEAESGWDMTPRFERKALDYLPIDLNSLLYKYEIDFAQISLMLGDSNASEMWQSRHSVRQKIVNELLWSELKHFYFDYNFIEGKLGNVWSLAAYNTLWSGLAHAEKGEWLTKQLHRFEAQGGLTTTCRKMFDFNIFGSVNTQWDYPNGWAPLHYFTIEGLEKYGYKEMADQIAYKWLKTNIDWFDNNGEFLEKYNMVDVDDLPSSGVYPTQRGFGWTNGIFAYLVKKYNLI